MEMHSGSDRRVIVGERWVVKVARSNPGNFIEYARYIRKHRGFGGVVKTWSQESLDGYSGLKWNLFHGITANRRERKLATMSDLVVPTQTLFAGLINIQPTTEDVSVEASDILAALADNLKEPGKNVPRLGHTVEDPANFGIHDGQIRFRDGGSLGLERILTETKEEPNLKRALGKLMIRHSDDHKKLR